MKQMKKALMCLMVTCLAVMLMVSCGGKESSDKEVIRLIVPGISEKSTVDPISGLTTLGVGDFEKFLNEQIPEVDIELVSISWDGWIQKLEAMATSDEMDVGFFTNQVAVPEWYLDLTPYLENDPEVNFDNLNEIFVDPAVHYTYNKSFNYPEATDKIYGLPMTMACNVLMYDKVLFDQWGVDYPTSETTFQELVEMSTKMTGPNPVTGKQNFGGYITNYWAEWFAISYDAVKPLFSKNMMLNEIDMNEHVEYIKNSPEVLEFFEDLTKIVENSPTAIAMASAEQASGMEKFYTEDNDIAIGYATNHTGGIWINYYLADYKEITDRFIPLLIPVGEKGQQGFPEFFRFSVAKNTKYPEASWEVVKKLTTDPDIVDFFLSNYEGAKVSALRDVSDVPFMQTDYNKMRHAHQMDSIFITDDYWTWRTPMQATINLVLARELSPVEARDHFYNGVKTWVENTKAQLGQ